MKNRNRCSLRGVGYASVGRFIVLVVLVVGLSVSPARPAHAAGVAFASAVKYGVGSSPFRVALGDLNGDGKPDIAVANIFSDTVSVLLNQGNGTFAGASDYRACCEPFSVI